MQILIIGAGRIGRSVAEALVDEDNDITLVDTDSERIEEMQDRLDLRGIVGNATSPDVLRQAGADDADMALAANGVIEMQGGICAASGGRLLTRVPLPLAGLLSPERPETLLAQLRAFLSDCARMGFHHKDLMSFFTIMPLAVSPEIKCTDRGLVDVAHKRFLPLIEERRGS